MKLSIIVSRISRTADMKMNLKVVVAVGFLLGSSVGVAHADTDDNAPAPVISTGGAITGTSQGNSCISRQTQKFAPTATSNPYGWAEPDWPGFAAVNTPTSSASCSR